MSRRTFHANLHLMDRQLVAEPSRRLVGKVDDVQLDLNADPPRVVCLISGPRAWVARLPRGLRSLLSPFAQRPDREIAFSSVTSVNSAVHIEQNPRHRDTHGRGTPTRLSDVLGLVVTGPDGRYVGVVADLALAADDHGAHLTGIVVVRRRHSRLFGYERPVWPAPLRMLARLGAGAIYTIDWDDVETFEAEGVTLRRSPSDS